jgi:hypothetical protein
VTSSRKNNTHKKINFFISNWKEDTLTGRQEEEEEEEEDVGKHLNHI